MQGLQSTVVRLRPVDVPRLLQLNVNSKSLVDLNIQIASQYLACRY